MACACVSMASWKLKLVDRGGVSQTVVRRLAKLLSADAVSPVQRTEECLGLHPLPFSVSKQSSILLCYDHLGRLLEEKMPSFLQER